MKYRHRVQDRNRNLFAGPERATEKKVLDTNDDLPRRSRSTPTAIRVESCVGARLSRKDTEVKQPS
jgi:hypothetical protein